LRREAPRNGSKRWPSSIEQALFKLAGRSNLHQQG